MAFALAAAALLLAWPVLPGLRRLGPFKVFPPFRAWAVRPHPDAAVEVRTGRRLDARTSATDAIVVVRTAWRNQDSREARPSLRASRPLAPVVSVDGVPASWGWGATELTLTPGTHLVAVAGGHSRCYRQVALAAGERLELDYAGVLGDTADRFALPGELRDPVSFMERRRPGSVALYYLLLLGGVAAAAALTWTALANPGILAAAPAAAITVGLGIGAAAIIAALRKQARLRRVAVAAPPAADDEPVVLDADEPARMAPAPGWAGLGLHLRYTLDRYPPEAVAALAGGKPNPLQRWRTVRIGEPAAPECRPWVPAPEVLLDGEPVAAGWTRTWTQLAPGDHDLVVRIPQHPTQTRPATTVDLTRAEHRTRFHAAPGETTAIALHATVTAIPSPKGPHLASYSAALH
ncbi:hypothetical protein [Glycomyces artemisiae]|uniref:Uncharacterized protein n=1 Tax=Glycomyces artemisiae TaxID=1076443 RepID=A0A2T0UWS1_9ACTN|nr:hypothetical protein [Glycomyces artemisiae]PRY62334.1 hypothetical protein B0I28_101662 [Glycomyces artemisiae]